MYNTEAKKYAQKARIIATLTKPELVGDYNVSTHQCDHKYSLFHGWIQSVPLEIICNKNNLRIISKYQNQKKRSSSSISIEELYETYEPNEKIKKLVKILEKYEQLEDLERLGKVAWAFMKELKEKQITKEEVENDRIKD